VAEIDKWLISATSGVLVDSEKIFDSNEGKVVRKLEGIREITRQLYRQYLVAFNRSISRLESLSARDQRS
jgi:hypothetical protein